MGHILIIFTALYCQRHQNPLNGDYKLCFQLDPKLILDVLSTEVLEDQSEIPTHIKINLFIFNCSYYASLRYCL